MADLIDMILLICSWAEMSAVSHLQYIRETIYMAHFDHK